METLAYLHLTATTGSANALAQGRSRTVPLGRAVPKTRTFALPSVIGAGLVGVATLVPLSAQAQATLSQGSEGPAVVELQQQLAALGYFDASATGYYGSITTEAVRRFQAAQGLQVDGVAGPATLGALLGGGSRSTGSTASNTGTGGTSGGGAASSSFNTATADLQADLASLGYYRGAIDGISGPLTDEALRNFQRDYGLAVTGLPNIEVFNALDAALADTSSNSDLSASSSGSSNGIPVIPAPDSGTVLASINSGSAASTKQESSKVVVQKAAEEIVVRQGNGAGSIVVQQHPERTVVETIPSTAVVVSPPGASATTTVNQPPVLTTAQPNLPFGNQPFTGSQPPGTAYANYPPALPNPIGNTGVPQPYYPTSTGGTAFANPPNYDASFYPYVVAIPHRSQEDLVTALRFSPGAFVAGSQRGTYINAGSYSSRAEAETLTQALRQQGLDARVIFRPR